MLRAPRTMSERTHHEFAKARLQTVLSKRRPATLQDFRYQRRSNAGIRLPLRRQQDADDVRGKRQEIPRVQPGRQPGGTVPPFCKQPPVGCHHRLTRIARSAVFRPAGAQKARRLRPREQRNQRKWQRTGYCPVPLPNARQRLLACLESELLTQIAPPSHAHMLRRE
jgi:hypothetical protein